MALTNQKTSKTRHQGEGCHPFDWFFFVIVTVVDYYISRLRYACQIQWLIGRIWHFEEQLVFFWVTLGGGTPTEGVTHRCHPPPPPWLGLLIPWPITITSWIFQKFRKKTTAKKKTHRIETWASRLSAFDFSGVIIGRRPNRSSRVSTAIMEQMIEHAILYWKDHQLFQLTDLFNRGALASFIHPRRHSKSLKAAGKLPVGHLKRKTMNLFK